MRIKDFIEVLGQYDPNTELVIDGEGEYASPKLKHDIVYYKHNFTGTSYKDNVLILTD